MSIEANKTAFRNWFDATWNAADPARIDAATADDFQLHAAGPGRIDGREALKATVAQWRAAFPDGRMELDFLFAEKDRVAARWTARGTHRGAFLGLPPTGRTVGWTGLTIYRLADGKVAEAWGEVDGLGLMRQLGPTGAEA